jgi:hypothetical protein
MLIGGQGWVAILTDSALTAWIVGRGSTHLGRPVTNGVRESLFAALAHPSGPPYHHFERGRKVVARKAQSAKKPSNGANVGYKAELWRMVDALRVSMEAAKNKLVLLGLIFLKYVCATFQHQHSNLDANVVHRKVVSVVRGLVFAEAVV